MVRIKTVLNLLAYSIALLGFVPLFPYLETVPQAVFPVALACGIIADKKGRACPGWLPTVISLLFFAFYAVQFSRDNFVGPAVNLLVILLSVRLFSEKNARNYLQIFALSLFSFTSSSLFNLSAVFLVYLSLIFVLVAVSLVILTFHTASSQPSFPVRGLKKILMTALVMPVAAVPLMLLIFFILPRTAFPFWNFLNVSGAKVTGLSDTITPGSSSAVGEVKNVAFRAHCERLPKERLYWRGIVLNAMEGNAWTRKEAPSVETGWVAKGREVHQMIYPEPGRTPYLAALNVPRGISGVRNSGGHDFTFMLRGGGTGRVKYEAVSILVDTIASRGGIDRNFYLKVAEGTSPQLVNLAKKIAEKGSTDQERVSLLEAEFMSRRLTYSTAGLPSGEFPLDQFLFGARKGNCEFFASSFAVLLRLAGVPSRLVGGYLGGEYNDIGGYYVVTDGMAHVWVEAFIQGKGWVTIDPSRWAVNFSDPGEAGKRSLAKKLGLLVDALSYYWNAAVINYDLDRQLRFIHGAGSGLKAVSFRASIRSGLFFAAALGAVMAIAAVQKRRRGRTREERIIAKFFRKIAKEYRIDIPPTTSLFDLSSRLDNPMVSRFVEVYGGAVYHDRDLTPEEIGELEAIVGNISGPRHDPDPGFISTPGEQDDRADVSDKP